MMRFDRFTERAQDAAMRAYEILQRYQHSQVDTEHLFLALLEQPDGLVRRFWRRSMRRCRSFGARSRSRSSKVPSPAACNSGQVAQVFITPRLKRVIDVANEEASKLKDEYISTEHLFLGIASERNTPFAEYPARSRRDQGAHPARRRRDPRRPAGHRTRRGDQIPHARALRPRPDPAGARGQAGPGDRPRRRDPARDPGAQPAHQEQPGADRRGRRGQDGHRRGAGAASRQRRCAGDADGQARRSRWTWAP